MTRELRILTAAGMRAAEAAAIAAGTQVGTLMERAGFAAAEAIWRFSGPLPSLVLCGPGNNGGDGYVIARELKARGLPVRVVAFAEPATEAASAVRALWDGAVERLEDAAPAALLIDSLFGTGLGRPLDPLLSDRLRALAAEARVRAAVDLPSGAATDDGRLLSPVPDFDLTVTFQTLKPVHLLQPAARHMGRLVVADIGIDPGQSGELSPLRAIGRPVLRKPGPDDHKYSRGMVSLIAGDMAGAIALAASAAAAAGAGYVRLFADRLVTNLPSAIVQHAGRAFEEDPRIRALVLGPGLGRGEEARRRLDAALATSYALVLDADALVLLDPERLARRDAPAILTPHAGEFERLFGALSGSKIDRVREAARRTASVVLFKGADSVVAAPDGRAAIAPPAPSWLASAGTGDVLTGIVAARVASGEEAFDAVCTSLWLHAEAAIRAGPFLIADDLVAQLPAVCAAAA